MVKEKEYYKRLDYLRIISCIMVLLYHINILKGGFLAVCTFFTLSGYLGCLSALKKENFSIKDYYINRLKKIYLPLIIVVFITITAFKIVEFTNWVNLKPETQSVLFGYNNFWQINAHLDYFTRNVSSPFMHFWYISILMQFELLFPLMFVLLKNINKKARKDISTIIVLALTIVTTILFLVMSSTQDIMMGYYNTFARSFSFFFGILLALLHYKYNFKISNVFKKFNKIIYLLYMLIFIIMSIFVSAQSENYAIFMILTTIISVRLIEYSTIRNQRYAKDNKWFNLLAKESYEIYLVQYPIIFFVQGLPIFDVIKNIIIIILVFVMAHLLSNLINISKHKMQKLIALTAIIIIGSFVFINQKDYSDEMKELENKLNDNLKVTEQQNNEFLNRVEEEKKEEKKEEKTTNAKIVNIEEEKTKIEEKVKQLPIIGVGDSVLLGASDELYKMFPNGYFDGKVSRSITGGKDVLQELKNQGKLSNTLVLALANNGDYSTKRNEALMEVLEDREIYWVSAVLADDPKYNDNFKEFASNYPNIHIIEWEEVSKGHPEYFYADGIHLKPDGVRAYVDTIYEAIYNNYWENFKKDNGLE